MIAVRIKLEQSVLYPLLIIITVRNDKSSNLLRRLKTKLQLILNGKKYCSKAVSSQSRMYNRVVVQ